MRKFAMIRTTTSPLSVREVAAMLGRSHSSLYRSIGKGRFPLPIITIGSCWRVPRRAVELLIDGEVTPPSRPAAFSESV
jgi:predicted DNA-binding transcriptional regulator AlpA